MFKRGVIAAALTVAVASSAAAQSTTTSTTTGSSSGQTAQSQPASSASTPTETRPATTTFMGDTGLWYVPTGEVLPRKKWSMSAYRVNYDDNQGFTDVSNWPIVGPGQPRRS
jgi:hypothetical protein